MARGGGGENRERQAQDTKAVQQPLTKKHKGLKGMGERERKAMGWRGHGARALWRGAKDPLLVGAGGVSPGQGPGPGILAIVRMGDTSGPAGLTWPQNPTSCNLASGTAELEGSRRPSVAVAASTWMQNFAGHAQAQPCAQHLKGGQGIPEHWAPKCKWGSLPEQRLWFF